MSKKKKTPHQISLEKKYRQYEHTAARWKAVMDAWEKQLHIQYERQVMKDAKS